MRSAGSEVGRGLFLRIGHGVPRGLCVVEDDGELHGHPGDPVGPARGATTRGGGDGAPAAPAAGRWRRLVVAPAGRRGWGGLGLRLGSAGSALFALSVCGRSGAGPRPDVRAALARRVRHRARHPARHLVPAAVTTPSSGVLGVLWRRALRPSGSNQRTASSASRTSPSASVVRLGAVGVQQGLPALPPSRGL